MVFNYFSITLGVYIGVYMGLVWDQNLDICMGGPHFLEEPVVACEREARLNWNVCHACPDVYGKDIELNKRVHAFAA